VYDPKSDSTRWVDITGFLEKNASLTNFVKIPAEMPFETKHFEVFTDHFLEYRERFSDDLHFVRALSALANLKNASECSNSIVTGRFKTSHLRSELTSQRIWRKLAGQQRCFSF
jgi:hypothetical protein